MLGNWREIWYEFSWIPKDDHWCFWWFLASFQVLLSRWFFHFIRINISISEDGSISPACSSKFKLFCWRRGGKQFMALIRPFSGVSFKYWIVSKDCCLPRDPACVLKNIHHDSVPPFKESSRNIPLCLRFRKVWIVLCRRINYGIDADIYISPTVSCSYLEFISSSYLSQSPAVTAAHVLCISV